MAGKDLKQRTKGFALRVLRLVEKLPSTRIASTIGNQLLRSGISVGANYRAACRARSSAEFCAKMGIVEEEADESMYWMELLNDAGILHPDDVEGLKKEADEIIAMTVASIRTARRQKKTAR